jgi:uncharacterized protein (TIGR02466 family)
VFPLFPTFIWQHELPAADAAKINRTLLEWLSALRPPADKYSAGRTWQTDTDLQDKPEMAELNRRVMTAGDGVLDFLGFEKSPLIISGAWANFGPPETSHHEHVHPNNFLSVVYYVKAPKGANTINFIDPRPQAHVMSPKVVKPSHNNASLVTVDVAPGQLILFPAWLRHSVDPNRAGEERLSIAMNLMFEDYGRLLSKPRFSSNIDQDRKN